MADFNSRIWMWCHNTGVYNYIRALGAQSDYSPVEALAYLGIKNAIMVVYGGKPEPPFEPIQQKYDHLDKVVWSIIGDSSSKRNRDKTDLDEVLALHAKHPNLVGGIMDDFFGISYPIEKLRDISKRMHDAGLPLWVVLYDYEIEKAEELGLAEKLPLCDVVTFWTWKASNLVNLKDNMKKVRQLVPDKTIVLGCYTWDFGTGTIVPEDTMMYQLEQGREWISDGTIHDMIILGSPLVGCGLAAIDQTRAWLKQHANDRI